MWQLAYSTPISTQLRALLVMPHDEILTDDYVADLLAQEAKDYSLRYSAMGMEALEKKPNTRFLRHIIKSTDSHNRALLAKETAESKARLEDLDRSQEAMRLRRNPNAREIRSRQMGDIRAILGAQKRTGHKRRSRSPDPDRTAIQGQQGSPSRQPSPEGSGSANGDDSDPLNDFIGPAPPANFRGRGTMGGAASLDRRFSESYDPKTDVDMGDGETDDWGDAAERFRDRQKLRLSQAQRMKAAGFTDEQLGRMQGEPEREVVWSKAGEQRAWDQGKDVDVEMEMDHGSGLFSEDN
ncbi:hypothetical protein CDD80_2778 [Ophiocordyceps camponoti-rufipedis]|uniref:Uncharacterized protein n=1 Tax=Ophiocordyceps camponoti-rufipedis TaxID=2004952 RepID=A0A2C5XJQ7_9HYPO|nr:hypothetical protein CDD80_2778 [Ophiocordyceps camponoti-rufipedis]